MLPAAAAKRLLRMALVPMAFGCRVEEPTQIVVWIETDLERPDELDGFLTEVGPSGQPATDVRAFTTSASGVSAQVQFAELPASFGVAPRGGRAGRRVEVGVEARLGGQTLFETRAITGFAEHERLRLDLFLAKRCVEQHTECEEQGLTCGRNGCTDPFVPPDTLPPWDGPPAAADAGAPTDGGRDAAPNDAAPNDAAATPDASPDAGVPPITPWAVTLVSGTAPFLSFVTGDDTGVAYVVTSFSQPVEVDGLDLGPNGDPDLLVFAVDPSGVRTAFAQIGAVASSITPTDIAWDGTDGVIVSGAYEGTPTPQFPRADTSSGFVARLRTSDLSVDWVSPFMALSAAAVNSVAVSPQSGIWAAGTLSDVNPSWQGFAARIDSEGGVRCSVPILSSVSAAAGGVAVDAAGAIVVSGGFEQDVDLGSGVVSPGLDDPGLFAASYDADCTYLHGIVGTGDAVPPQVGATQSGQRWLVAGAANGPVDIGGLNLPGLGLLDAAVFVTNGALAPVGLAQYGGVGSDEVVQVADAPGRPPLIAGLSTADASFGAAAVLPPIGGAADGWVVAVDDLGAGLWAIAVQGDGLDSTTSAAWDPSSAALFATGSFQTPASVDGLPLEFAPSNGFGVYLARLAPPD